MGYTRSEMVTTPGEFAVRGGIFDIYPPYAEYRFVLNLFDTEVDSIRAFDADDQRSIEKLQSRTYFAGDGDYLLTTEERIESSRTFRRSA